MPYPQHILDAYAAYLALHKQKSMFVPKNQISTWDESERYARAPFPGQDVQGATGVNLDSTLPYAGLSSGGQISIQPRPWASTLNHPSQIVNPLPHEMSHDLVTRLSQLTGEDEETIAAKAMSRLGPYSPMFAIPASNQNSNMGEQLAERVQQPYTDAQEVGRRFQQMQNQNYAPAPNLPNYFNSSNIS